MAEYTYVNTTGAHSLAEVSVLLTLASVYFPHALSYAISAGSVDGHKNYNAEKSDYKAKLYAELYEAHEHVCINPAMFNNISSSVILNTWISHPKGNLEGSGGMRFAATNCFVRRGE